MNAFLNALKTKSAKMNRSLASSIQPNIGIKIDSDFGTPNQTLVDLNTGKDIEYNPKIERIVNTGKINLLFPSKPSKEIRESLKNEGFWFDPVTLIWSAKDNLSNRLLLNELFGAVFDNLQQELASIQVEASKTEDPSLEPEICEPEVSYEGNDQYKKFKYQVASLQHELKLDAADLMLEAINKLYEFTFKQN